MMRPTFIFIILIALTLAAIRIAGHTSEAFQAAAHLFVGGLVVASYMHTERRVSAFYFWTVAALTVVEVLCFVVSHV